MAKTGLAIPIAAKYVNDGFGNVTYTGGLQFAKAVEYSTSFGDKKANSLYADNGISERQNIFSGGEITLKTDDLDQEASKLLLGIREEEIAYNGKTARVLVNRSDDISPYLGLGIVVQGQRNNAPYYTAIILPKIAFSTPEDAFKTQGESIEWQTPSIPGTIMRDDTPEHKWRYKAEFPTEAGAVEFIKWFLNMLPGTLTVTSTAGSAVNMTAISVAPVKPAGGGYKYLLGTEVYSPDKNAVAPDTYSEWDGAAEIEAREGQKILVVEVDAEGKIQRAGTAAVIVKGDAA